MVNGAFYFAMRFIFLSYEMFLFDDVFYLMMCFILNLFKA